MSLGDRYWNPDPLQPGERVRVVPSPECPRCARNVVPLFFGAPGVLIDECPFGDGLPRRGPAAVWRHLHFAGHDHTILLDEPVDSPIFGRLSHVCVARMDLERA